MLKFAYAGPAMQNCTFLNSLSSVSYMTGRIALTSVRTKLAVAFWNTAQRSLHLYHCS